MRALLLAAGLGTRLRPLTDGVPKCLIPIHGVPLIDYWFALLFTGGIERVLVNTGHLAERVETHLQACRWRDRVDSVHEPELLGTGGTVLANRAWFTGDAFLVAHADNLTRFDLEGLRARHKVRPRGCAITMMTFTTDNPRSCGIVEEDANGIVVGFHEKVADPPGTHANAAVYVFEPEVVALMAGLGQRVIDLSTEVIPRFIGRIVTFHNNGYHRDIGTPESLRLARAEFPPPAADG